MSFELTEQLKPYAGADNVGGLDKFKVWYVILVSSLLVAIWIFPSFWYTKHTTGAKLVWLKENINVTGWMYQPVELEKAAERQLQADVIVSGEFKNLTNGVKIRVFSAKRYNENPNVIGLFVHTPDRCWTEAGWRIIPIMPDVLVIDIHGIRLQMERRLFVNGLHYELVYFGGLVGGEPLPYRLDHNLDVGIYVAMKEARKEYGAGAEARAVNKRFWSRILESFISRKPLYGPKQFIRISTAIMDQSPQALIVGDDTIQSFLPYWLTPTDYQQELAQWNMKISQ